MNRRKKLLSSLKPLFVSAAVVLSCPVTSRAAQTVEHLGIAQPGGMPGLPICTGIQKLTNGVRVTWDGPSGYYQLYQKSNNLSAHWVALGKATNLARSAVVTTLYSNAFFRVLGPSPGYAGAQICAGCHGAVHSTWMLTEHEQAFAEPLFVALGGQTNASCLACHTVGYNLPTGFSITNKNGIPSYTTNLAGVQCESCHGPAANHASNPGDPTVIPRVELAAQVCGGCHSAGFAPVAVAEVHPPVFDNWSASPHAAVVPDVLTSMSSSPNNVSRCGRCHSGSARLALLQGRNPSTTLTNDFDVAITCAVCHDPHETNANPAQLRNPLSSTNDYYLSTSDVFTNKYNPGINVCAQCHNDRGDFWMTTVTNNSVVTTNYLTARAPHRSLQYNFLLGSIGEFLDGPAAFNPGSHAGLPGSARFSISGTFYLTNQCIDCHMQPDNSVAGTHNHLFELVSHEVCMNCHLTEPGQSAVTISNDVAGVIAALNLWAAAKAPPALQTNGLVAWEYTEPGGLIWQTNLAGQVTGWTLADEVNFSGPDAAGQALIPVNIKKARFNLYLVLNDGSLGAHNLIFAISLLNAAQFQVLEELFQ